MIVLERQALGRTTLQLDVTTLNGSDVSSAGLFNHFRRRIDTYDIA